MGGGGGNSRHISWENSLILLYRFKLQIPKGTLISVDQHGGYKENSHV